MEKFKLKTYFHIDDPIKDLELVKSKTLIDEMIINCSNKVDELIKSKLKDKGYSEHSKVLKYIINDEWNVYTTEDNKFIISVRNWEVESINNHYEVECYSQFTDTDFRII